MANVFLGYPDPAARQFMVDKYLKRWNSILHFTAEVDGSSVAMVRSDNGWDENFKLECSVDRGEWELWNGFKVELNKGQTVYIRAVSANSTVSTHSLYYGFKMYGKIAGGGSVQYLIDKIGKNLDLTGLGNYCYYKMFYYCTSLTAAPELPAQTLTGHCYDSMFQGCTSLTAAPELPAQTLAVNCYSSMFHNCTSLTAAPELPAQTLKTQCYYNMFYGCTNLTAAPELPAQTLAGYCYMSMFYNCTSLTAAPELPAQTLKTQCYYQMFKYCTSLKIREGGTEGTKVLDLPAGTEEQPLWNGNMFLDTGGEFTGTPEIGKAYYCYQ